MTRRTTRRVECFPYGSTKVRAPYMLMRFASGTIATHSSLSLDDDGTDSGSLPRLATSAIIGRILCSRNRNQHEQWDNLHADCPKWPCLTFGDAGRANRLGGFRGPRGDWLAARAPLVEACFAGANPNTKWSPSAAAIRSSDLDLCRCACGCSCCSGQVGAGEAISPRRTSFLHSAIQSYPALSSARRCSAVPAGGY